MKKEMQNKKVVLFDLDGTLTKSDQGIINSMLYMLEKRGAKMPSNVEMNELIGPPLHESFSKVFRIPEDEIDEAIAIYREYYSSRGLYENTVYNGIYGLLELLKGQGKILALATSKAEYYAIKVMEHFKLDKYFRIMRGSELSGGITEKHEVIAAVLEDLKNNRICDSKSDIVMVGDRSHDVIGAKMNGIESIGVLYGYGNEAELNAAGADAIATDVSGLKKMLLS